MFVVDKIGRVGKENGRRWMPVRREDERGRGEEATPAERERGSAGRDGDKGAYASIGTAYLRKLSGKTAGQPV